MPPTRAYVVLQRGYLILGLVFVCAVVWFSGSVFVGFWAASGNRLYNWNDQAARFFLYGAAAATIVFYGMIVLYSKVVRK